MNLLATTEYVDTTKPGDLFRTGVPGYSRFYVNGRRVPRIVYETGVLWLRLKWWWQHRG